MKKMKPLILLLAIVFGLTSCQKEEIVEPSSRRVIIDTTSVVDTTGRPPISEDPCYCYYIIWIGQTHASGYDGCFINCYGDTVYFDMSTYSYENNIDGDYYCGPI